MSNDNEIILIRHAQSKWNANESQKQDGGLTELGKNSCLLLKFDVELVICSSLKRARSTLQHSQIKYKELIFTDLCAEINGTDEEQKDFKLRIEKFKNMLINLQETYQTICVISHKPILRELTGLEFQNTEFVNFPYQSLLARWLKN